MTKRSAKHELIRDGSAFQFAAGAGIIPLNLDAGPLQQATPPDTEQPHVLFRPTEMAPQPTPVRMPPVTTAVQTKLGKLHGTREVLKAARQRIRELKAEIKRMHGLERELAELERLVNAAKSKPIAQVRNIRRNTG